MLMIDPVYAIPFFIVFTITGYIVFFQLFIRAPYRGFRHIYNLLNKNTDASTREESREIVSGVGRGISSYLIFFVSLIVGIAIITLVGALGIPVLSILTMLIVGVGLLLIYSWAQNRI
jgi:hypothetical protein